MAFTDRHHRVVALAVVAVLVCALVSDRESMAQQANSTAPPFARSASLLSGILPVEVNLPSNVTTPLEARRWFIALNWPAAPGKRGVPLSPNNPSVFLNAGNGYSAVWGTYREAYELYR